MLSVWFISFFSVFCFVVFHICCAFSPNSFFSISLNHFFLSVFSIPAHISLSFSSLSLFSRFSSILLFCLSFSIFQWFSTFSFCGGPIYNNLHCSLQWLSTFQIQTYDWCYSGNSFRARAFHWKIPIYGYVRDKALPAAPYTCNYFKLCGRSIDAARRTKTHQKEPSHTEHPVTHRVVQEIWSI